MGAGRMWLGVALLAATAALVSAESWFRVRHNAQQLFNKLAATKESFGQDTATAAKNALMDAIVSQERAVGSIVDTLHGFDSGGPSSSSALLAFVGPTGVGKTVAAHTVARAVLSSSMWSHGEAMILSMRGEHFAASGTTDQGQQLADFRSTLARHLMSTGGFAVVIVDEAQKMSPGVLDALLPFLDTQHPHSMQIDGTTQRIPVRRILAVLVSDMGTKVVADLLAKGASRGHMQAALRENLAHVAPWGGSALASRVTTLVPFLPLGPGHIATVAGLFLRRLQSSWALDVPGRSPASLDVGPQVHALMAYYVKFKLLKGAGGQDGFILSQYGARPVHMHDEGPLRRLQAKLFALTPALQAQAQAAPPGNLTVRVEVDWGQQEEPSLDWVAEDDVSKAAWLTFTQAAAAGQLHISLCAQAGATVDPHGGVLHTGPACAAPVWSGTLAAT